MKYTVPKIIVALVVVVVVALVVIFVAGPLLGSENRTPGAGSATDGISVSKDAQGNQRILARAAGYAATIPADWQVEPRSGGNLAVYPAVVPGNATSAACKIELSVFGNSAKQPLDAWIPAHLREDPTVVIVQISLEERPAANSSVTIWTGTMDGMKTVIAYGANDKKIYEIVPSSLDPSDPSPDACMGYFDQFLSALNVN